MFPSSSLLSPLLYLSSSVLQLDNSQEIDTTAPTTREHQATIFKDLISIERLASQHHNRRQDPAHSIMWSIVIDQGNKNRFLTKAVVDITRRSLSVLPSMGLMHGTAVTTVQRANGPNTGLALLHSNHSSFHPAFQHAHAPNVLNNTITQIIQSRAFSQPPNGMNLGNIFNNASGQKSKPGETLAQYGIDLTSLAKEGKLDPVIGRHEEIRRTLQILARRTKNNPVLIGEYGAVAVYRWCAAVVMIIIRLHFCILIILHA